LTAWKIVPLRDVVTSYIGGGWGSDVVGDQFSDPAWVIRGTDFPTLQSGDASSCPCRFHKRSNLSKRLLRADDIVMEVSGGSKDQPVGRALLVSAQMLSKFDGAVLPASFCKLIRPNPERVDSAFLYYFLRHLYDTREIVQFQIQSTGISNFQFETFLDGQFIELPELVVQRKIAAILSAYDDLIENNNRRIKLLEEMAQRIYREWFVDFRYPEHESVALVDSELGPIPDGWRLVSLSEVADTQYGYTESANTKAVGPRFLRGMDINKASYIDWSTVPYCPISPSDHEKYRLSPGDVVVIRMADPGKVGIVEVEVDAVFASYLIRVRPLDEHLQPYFLFHFMDSDRYQGFVSGASTGTTRKSLSAPLITSVKLALPPEELQHHFVESVSPLRQLLTRLIAVNANLRAARDLLLPRFISGEVDVTDLDIAMPETAT
jgi:type I restriction enzyme S subunit